MSDQAPHPTGRRTGAGALLLTLLAGLLVLLAGVAAVFVLPFVVVLTAMGGDNGGVPAWPVYVWVAVAFLSAIYAIIAGLGEMQDPRAPRVFSLLGIAILIFFSFPPFWLAGY